MNKASVFSNTITQYQILTLDGINEFANSAASFVDIDNDGKLDIVICGKVAGVTKTVIFRNSGNSTNAFTVFQLLDGFSDGSITVGDYNRDGYVDILIAGRDSGGSPKTIIYKNNNGINFTKTNIELQGAFFADINFVDFNKDGALDISISGFGPGSGYGNYAGYNARLYVNDGKENFNIIQSTLPPLANGMMKWSDYNNDGYPDVCVVGTKDFIAGISEQTFYYGSIFRNDKSSFTKIFDFQGLQNVSCVWGDYNNDNFIDFAVSGMMENGSSITRIYKNSNASFSTTDYIELNPGLQRSSMAFGDLDNDGDMDFVIIGSSNSSSPAETRFFIYRNDNGVFNDTGLGLGSITGVYKGAVLLADFDKDKDLDILVTGSFNSADNEVGFSRIYKNNAADSNGDNKPNFPPEWSGEDIYLSSYTSTYNGTTGELTLVWPNPKLDKNNTDVTKGVYYNIMLGKSSGKDDLVSARYGTPLFGNLLSKRKLPDGRNVTTFKVSSTDYFWRVQAIDPALGNSWAEPGKGGIDPVESGWEVEEHIFVDTSPPTGCPSIPQDEGEYTYSKNLKFKFTKNTSADSETGIAKFYLQVYENNISSPSKVIFNEAIGATELGTDIFSKTTDYIFNINIPGAGYGNKYYARIKARHGYNFADNAEIETRFPVNHWTEYSEWSDGIEVLKLLKIDNNLYRPLQNDTKPCMSFSLIKDSYVELFIYNLSGDLVKELDKGFKTQGSYTISWDGTNDNNELVTSGIYLVNIKVGENIAIEKIALIK